MRVYLLGEQTMSQTIERSKPLKLDLIDIRKTIRDTISASIPIFATEVSMGREYWEAAIITAGVFICQLAMRFLKANNVEVKAL